MTFTKARKYGGEGARHEGFVKVEGAGQPERRGELRLPHNLIAQAGAEGRRGGATFSSCCGGSGSGGGGRGCCGAGEGLLRGVLCRRGFEGVRNGLWGALRGRAVGVRGGCAQGVVRIRPQFLRGSGALRAGPCAGAHVSLAAAAAAAAVAARRRVARRAASLSLRGRRGEPESVANANEPGLLCEAPAGQLRVVRCRGGDERKRLRRARRGSGARGSRAHARGRVRCSRFLLRQRGGGGCGAVGVGCALPAARYEVLAVAGGRRLLANGPQGRAEERLGWGRREEPSVLTSVVGSPAPLLCSRGRPRNACENAGPTGPGYSAIIRHSQRGQQATGKAKRVACENIKGSQEPPTSHGRLALAEDAVAIDPLQLLEARGKGFCVSKLRFKIIWRAKFSTRRFPTHVTERLCVHGRLLSDLLQGVNAQSSPRRHVVGSSRRLRKRGRRQPPEQSYKCILLRLDEDWSSRAAPGGHKRKAKHFTPARGWGPRRPSRH